MMKRFISLEWKQFKRSSYFQRSLAIKILLIFAALYFIACFLLMGTSAYFILDEMFPEKDPVVLVNNYLVYWFLIDLVYRFFLQKLPVMNVKPYMILPIKRPVVIHYLLGRTSLSFFNFLPLFFFLPFSVVLLTQGYSAALVIPWFFAMLFFEQSVSFLNFLLNKNDKVFYGLLGLLVILAGLQYFGIYEVTAKAGYVFNKIFNTPYAVLIPLLLTVLLYRRTFKFVREGFYLDDKMRQKIKVVKTTEMDWLNRFGEVAVFLKNDLRLIWRNKRPKQVLLGGFLFLFYGLIFFTQDMYEDNMLAISFAAIFITGGFLLTFGQQVPAWDSEYYKLLMSQNIPYRKYLESKWYLIVFGVLVSMVLSVPYLFFGWKTYVVILAAGVFNLGLNSFVTLYGGALNRVPIKLNVKAKAFGNTQSFSATQMLIALPKMVLPVLLFCVPYWVVGFWAGTAVLALSGVAGLIFKDFLMTQVEKIYQKGKYKTVAAFDE